jgi:hypothetical protein
MISCLMFLAGAICGAGDLVAPCIVVAGAMGPLFEEEP